MFLFDTNVCINASVGTEPDASCFSKAIDENSAALSVITVAEFLSKASASESQSFGDLVNALPVLEIKLTTAQLAAGFRRQSRKTSRIALLDCFLAAQAHEYDLTLVTNNQTDFSMKGVKVTAPFSPRNRK